MFTDVEGSTRRWETDADATRSALAAHDKVLAITHLREVLGDERYESLAQKGEAMTISAVVTYAIDQIDQTRAELNAAS